MFRFFQRRQRSAETNTFGKYDPASREQFQTLITLVHQNLTRIQSDREVIEYHACTALYVAAGIGHIVGINICDLERVQFASQAEREQKIKRAIKLLDDLISGLSDWLLAETKDSAAYPGMLLAQNTARHDAALIWKGFLCLQLGPDNSSTPEIISTLCLRILCWWTDARRVTDGARNMFPESERAIASSISDVDWPPPSLARLFGQGPAPHQLRARTITALKNISQQFTFINEIADEEARRPTIVPTFAAALRSKLALELQKIISECDCLGPPLKEDQVSGLKMLATKTLSELSNINLNRDFLTLLRSEMTEGAALASDFAKHVESQG